MTDLRKTQTIPTLQDIRIPASEVLEKVYQALVEKGYNPVNQIVGYIMSGDPTYITSYGGARTMISKVDRDELLEELVTTYIETMQARY
ncbi:MAG: IreB family regulatory phosphoprotein [Lachnospiraceae bacterium]|nr:IreB family regulatory phosphoprotein [Lachnospiraceae bacterium]